MGAGFVDEPPISSRVLMDVDGLWANMHYHCGLETRLVSCASARKQSCWQIWQKGDHKTISSSTKKGCSSGRALHV